MQKKRKLRCAGCRVKDCAGGKDCFASAGRHREFYYDSAIGTLHKAAAAIEGRHYGRETRLREIMLFAQEMGFHKLGLAFCVGLSDEAGIINKIMSQDFEVVSVCCKVGGIDKQSLGLEQIDGDRTEISCNPAGQADLLNRAATELNILCGLCVGHDAIFSMVSEAPVVTLIAKDRVLAHNPIGAVYCQYVRRGLIQDSKAM